MLVGVYTGQKDDPCIVSEDFELMVEKFFKSCFNKTKKEVDRMVFNYDRSQVVYPKQGDGQPGARPPHRTRITIDFRTGYRKITSIQKEKILNKAKEWFPMYKPAVMANDTYEDDDRGTMYLHKLILLWEG